MKPITHSQRIFMFRAILGFASLSLISSCQGETDSQLKNSCGRTAIINGGTSPACTGEYPSVKQPKREPVLKPSITDGEIVDQVKGLIREDQNTGCLLGIDVTITKYKDRFWAFVADKVYVNRNQNGVKSCVYRIKDRYPEAFNVTVQRDRFDSNCFEFVGYKSRRQTLVIRNRQQGSRQCYRPDFNLRNVMVKSDYYRGARVMAPYLPPMPDDVDSRALTEIGGWDYIEDGNDAYLGDFNKSIKAAYINIDTFRRVRNKFHAYLSSYNYQIKPTIRGYESRFPKWTNIGGVRTEVPYIHVTNIVLSYNDYLRLKVGEF